MELILAQDAALPPGGDEPQAVADELRKSGSDAEQPDLYAFVFVGRVDEDQQGIENQGKERQPHAGASHVFRLRSGGKDCHTCTEEEEKDEGDDSYGKDHRKEMDHLQ